MEAPLQLCLTNGVNNSGVCTLQCSRALRNDPDNLGPQKGQGDEDPSLTIRITSAMNSKSLQSRPEPTVKTFDNFFNPINKSVPKTVQVFFIKPSEHAVQ